MRTSKLASFVALCTLALALPATGHEAHHDKAVSQVPPEVLSRAIVQLPRDAAAQRKYFTDLPLLDQEGKTRRFYSDVLQDKLVIIDFIYTHCENACPLLSKKLADTQALLGKKLNKEIFLVSISVDPERDSPARLKDYARKYQARPGWTFLTGKKENVDWVIHKLGQYNADIEAHSPLLILGNLKSGRWMRLRGDASPEMLASMAQNLLETP